MGQQWALTSTIPHGHRFCASLPLGLADFPVYKASSVLALNQGMDPYIKSNRSPASVAPPPIDTNGITPDQQRCD